MTKLFDLDFSQSEWHTYQIWPEVRSKTVYWILAQNIAPKHKRKIESF